MRCKTGGRERAGFVLQAPLPPFLLLASHHLLELGLVLGLAAGSRLALDDTDRLWLAHPLTGVGLYCLGG